MLKPQIVFSYIQKAHMKLILNYIMLFREKKTLSETSALYFYMIFSHKTLSLLLHPKFGVVYPSIHINI